MNSRERVVAAINHERPDRVPFDLGSTDVTGIQVDAYARLCRALEVVETPRLVDPIQGLAQISENVRSRLQIDTTGVWLNPTLLPRAESTVIDEWGTVWRTPSHGAWYEPIVYPLAHVGPGELGEYHFPDPADRVKLDGVAECATYAFEHTDYALVANFSGALLARGQLLRGPAEFLADLLADPEWAAEILDGILEYNIQLVEAFLDRVGDTIQVIKVSDDLGGQDNLLISPALYRRMIKPRQAKFFAAIHARTSARLLYHSCGSINKVMDDLIEIGVDILNPIQVSAREMDSDALGKRYGARIAFWGAVDNQGAICQGTPEAVRADVRRRISDLGARGGFVMASSHNLAHDTPAENMLALCQAERRVPIVS